MGCSLRVGLGELDLFFIRTLVTSSILSNVFERLNKEKKMTRKYFNM